MHLTTIMSNINSLAKSSIFNYVQKMNCLLFVLFLPINALMDKKVFFCTPPPKKKSNEQGLYQQTSMLIQKWINN